MSGLNSIYNNAGFALQRQMGMIACLQEQAATGARINRSSDDPSDAYRLLGLSSQKRSLEGYMGTISNTIGILDTSSSAIKGMMETYLKTREVLAGTTGTDGEIGQAIHSEAINSYLEDLVMFANWKYSGHYLFGGSDTSSAPYDIEYTNGKITSVTYQGGEESRNIEVAYGVESSAFYVGDEIFSQNNRQAPQFLLGTTGIEAGTGTSSVKGYVWLEITQPGGDGTAYRLSIDGGQSYVDTSAYPPTETNLKITDSQTGQVLYVDATKITSTGVDMVDVPGTHDIFETLITARDIIENDRSLTSDQVKTLKDSVVETVDQMHIILTETYVSVGAKTGVLENLRESLDEIKFNTETEATFLGEADIAQIAIDLSRQQVLYEMSLAVVGKILSLSLLDFIR